MSRRIDAFLDTNCSSDLLGVDSRRQATPLTIVPPLIANFLSTCRPGRVSHPLTSSRIGTKSAHRRFDAVPGDVEGFDLSGLRAEPIG